MLTLLFVFAGIALLMLAWPLLEALFQVVLGLFWLAWVLAIGLVMLILPFALLSWLL